MDKPDVILTPHISNEPYMGDLTLLFSGCEKHQVPRGQLPQGYFGAQLTLLFGSPGNFKIYRSERIYQKS